MLLGHEADNSYGREDLWSRPLWKGGFEPFKFACRQHDFNGAAVFFSVISIRRPRYEENVVVSRQECESYLACRHTTILCKVHPRGELMIDDSAIYHSTVRMGSDLASTLNLPKLNLSDPGGYFAATGTVFPGRSLRLNGSQAI